MTMHFLFTVKSALFYAAVNAVKGSKQKINKSSHLICLSGMSNIIQRELSSLLGCRIVLRILLSYLK